MNLSIHHSKLPLPRAEAYVDQVLAEFELLPVGGWLELDAEQNLQPLWPQLRQQLEAQWPGQFDWLTLASGSLPGRVRLSRKPAAKPACCGCCGGASAKSSTEL